MPIRGAEPAALPDGPRRQGGGWASPGGAAGPAGAGGPLAAGTLLRLGQADAPQSATAPDGAALVMAVDNGEAVLFTIRFPAALGQAYHAAVAALLRRLRDDLVLSYRATRALTQEARPPRPALEAGWDRLMAGVALLSSRLRVEAANVATDDLLADRRFFLPPVAGVMRPAATACADRLAEAAARLLQGASATETLALAALRGRQRLLLRLHRLDRTSLFGGNGETTVPGGGARLIAVIEAERPGTATPASRHASTLASLAADSAETVHQESLCRA